MSNFTQLKNNLEILELKKIYEDIDTLIDNANKTNISYIDFLLNLTDEEIKFRDERAKKINIVVSNFPYYKTIKDFDFSYQPGIDKKKIEDLLTLRFIESKTNIVFMGTSGVGKTHLATAIGIEAASQRISTYYISFSSLMEKFKNASKENRVEQVVKHYLKYTVLIIDEIGYLPIERDTSYAFFQLIAARYEKKPTILTTNLSFSKWGNLFGDSVVANAILDRIVHHCEIIKINGLSYRMKGKNIYDDEE